MESVDYISLRTPIMLPYNIKEKNFKFKNCEQNYITFNCNSNVKSINLLNLIKL